VEAGGTGYGSEVGTRPALRALTSAGVLTAADQSDFTASVDCRAPCGGRPPAPPPVGSDPPAWSPEGALTIRFARPGSGLRSQPSATSRQAIRPLCQESLPPEATGRPVYDGPADPAAGKATWHATCAKMRQVYAQRRAALLAGLQGELVRWLEPVPATAGLRVTALCRPSVDAQFLRKRLSETGRQPVLQPAVRA
jgi:hypothetical protein